ncbi:MAG: glycosyltransferase [bacterium]|nr:glycosyltransferase [bacterium]
MKILMLSNHYLPHMSGVATSITRTIRNLEKLGHEVKLIVPAFPEFTETNPKIYRVPSYPFRPPLIPLPYPGKSFIAKVVTDFKPDIIHTHQPFMLGKTGLKVALKNHIPFVFTHHAMYEQYVHYAPFLPNSLLQKIIVRRVMRFANKVSAVVAPSESVAKILHERKIKTPVFIIPTGINPEFFVRGPETRNATRKKWGVKKTETVIISFARLAAEKNFELLLKAFALLQEKTKKPLRLILGGDGPATNSLKKLAEKLDLGKKIIFTGSFPYTDVPDFLIGADIFAYPSLSETQGLVTLEALATGLPTVVVDAPGNRDIVKDGISGLITNPTVKDFTSKILSLITSPKLRTALAEQSIPRATDFSEEKMAEKMVNLYKSLLR